MHHSSRCWPHFPSLYTLQTSTTTLRCVTWTHIKMLSHSHNMETQRNRCCTQNHTLYTPTIPYYSILYTSISRAPTPPEGQCAPRPRRWSPLLWAGDKQNTPVHIAGEKPTNLDPDYTASPRRQTENRDLRRPYASRHLLICGVHLNLGSMVPKTFCQTTAGVSSAPPKNP